MGKSDQERAKRLAEALRANLRRRKNSKVEVSATVADPDARDRSGD